MKRAKKARWFKVSLKEMVEHPILRRYPNKYLYARFFLIRRGA